MATTSTKKRQEIGERLRHERERLGYTKQQIAQLLGVPIPAYERFENGDDDPGVYRLPRSCRLRLRRHVHHHGRTSRARG